MRKLLIAIMLAAIAGCTPLFAPGSGIHELRTKRPGVDATYELVRAWCMDEDSARALSDIVTKFGDDGYTQAMRHPGVDCVDIRINPGAAPVMATRVELAWTMTHYNGKQFEFWLMMGPDGTLAYAWFPVPGVST